METLAGDEFLCENVCVDRRACGQGSLHANWAVLETANNEGLSAPLGYGWHLRPR